MKKHDAIILIDKALPIETNNVLLLGSKGLLLDDLGKYEDAIVWYDKVGPVTK